jgi:hypothetical protein
MTKNKVYESTRFLVENPKHVFINEKKIEEIAQKFSKEKLIIPDWKFPVHLQGRDEDVIDFFMLGDSINFAYTDFDTGIKFSTLYKDTEWKGAFAMRACIKRAFENAIPILDGKYLKNISEKEMKDVFTGNIEIPMFAERLNIFREVGDILCNKYNAHFYNLVKRSNERAFYQGKGMVERLTQDFPSFDDSVKYQDRLVRFDKRAQLTVGSLYGRFRNKGLFKLRDVEDLSVFSDYVLPKALRDFEILTYEKTLAEKVDKKQIIPKNSREELEIRASTIHSCKKIIDEINNLRNTKEKINVLHLDYKLWYESRDKKGSPHHLTVTTAY